MRPMRGMKGWGAFDGLEGLQSIEDAQEIEETRAKNWARVVGAARADRALAMARGTLPERLAEAWLIAAGVQFRAQVALPGARPDFVLFGMAGGCVVWRVQGDYWHTLPGKESYDTAQAKQLLNEVVDGQRIVAVIDIWERDINESDAAFERAYEQSRHGRRDGAGA